MIGRVESVTWRTTVIRTNDNSNIIVPNSRIAREPVEIHSLNGLNRRVLRFQGPYSIPPRKIIAVVRQARLVEISRAVPEEEKQRQSESILRRIQRFFSLN